ncbi:response regulator transcription factor [Maridesulfovibrio zosterae]|uniref:response regulator transcription factor n=1 Tax=Maridesulfovibrio zosterae TaxID=82171 RepID=UPI00040DC906|nr:response regulator transcription factor [Maridesulfovibrio zosterae]
MGISVLLVEDDYDLAAAVVGSLELEGISCDHASNGMHGYELATQNDYDVLMFDVMLPRLSGIGLCDKLRKEGLDTPVLMLTALDTLDDKTAGFNAGTDDYLTKPFDMEELLLRIRALSRRYSRQSRKFIAAGLEMNLDTHEVWRNGQSLNLTPTEWKLLQELVMNSPKVVSRAKLEQAVWGDSIPSQSLLKVYLNKLRKKVDGPDFCPIIHTVPGVGVVLRQEDECAE